MRTIFAACALVPFSQDALAGSCSLTPANPLYFSQPTVNDDAATTLQFFGGYDSDDGEMNAFRVLTQGELDALHAAAENGCSVKIKYSMEYFWHIQGAGWARVEADVWTRGQHWNSGTSAFVPISAANIPIDFYASTPVGWVAYERALTDAFLDQLTIGGVDRLQIWSGNMFAECDANGSDSFDQASAGLNFDSWSAGTENSSVTPRIEYYPWIP